MESASLWGLSGVCSVVCRSGGQGWACKVGGQRWGVTLDDRRSRTLVAHPSQNPDRVILSKIRAIASCQA
ncbi:MAG: hypothetical protein VKK80_00390 [Prochlorothrix sp.]|nr:hypothetical protein [Prochlorothrix sp.]